MEFAESVSESARVRKCLNVENAPAGNGVLPEESTAVEFAQSVSKFARIRDLRRLRKSASTEGAFCPFAEENTTVEIAKNVSKCTSVRKIRKFLKFSKPSNFRRERMYICART